MLYLSCVLGILATSLVSSAPLVVLGEARFPPYSFVETHATEGTVEGLAVRVVQNLLAELDEPAQVELLPWTRGYQTALNEPNVLLFPIRRTAEREPLFHWIGVVAPYRMSVYALLPELRELVTHMAQAQQLRIGILNRGYVESELVRQGFEVGRNLFRVGHMEQNVHKLMDGRIDLLPIGDLSMAYMLNQEFHDATNKPYPLFRFSPHMDENLYLALSKSTPVEVAKQLQEELGRMHQDGRYQQLITDYLVEIGLAEETANPYNAGSVEAF